MNELKYYKRNGYEFQVVQRSGDVCRAIGRRGKTEIHQVIDHGKFRTFSSEEQAVDLFTELSEIEGKP